VHAKDGDESVEELPTTIRRIMDETSRKGGGLSDLSGSQKQSGTNEGVPAEKCPRCFTDQTKQWHYLDPDSKSLVIAKTGIHNEEACVNYHTDVVAAGSDEEFFGGIPSNFSMKYSAEVLSR
jgi:hypothetical protein